MEQTKYEVIEYEGKEARLYPDGAIRNERGHFITQHPSGHTISETDAAVLAKRKHEKKREIIAHAANRAVERGDFKVEYGDWAYLADIAYNMQQVATTPDNPRIVQAAEWIAENTGNSEKQAQQQDQPGSVTNNILIVDDDMFQALERIKGLHLHEGNKDG